jgi:hypothetical protein
VTKQEFKMRWESDEDGGGITFDDIADCAQQWGLCSRPRTMPIFHVKDMVVSAAGCSEDES